MPPNVSLPDQQLLVEISGEIAQAIDDTITRVCLRHAGKGPEDVVFSAQITALAMVYAQRVVRGGLKDEHALAGIQHSLSSMRQLQAQMEALAKSAPKK